jgi:hypothetical protein
VEVWLPIIAVALEFLILAGERAAEVLPLVHDRRQDLKIASIRDC